MVAAAYERGKAINMASFGEIDQVIDPKDSRRWIMAGLERGAEVEVCAGRRAGVRGYVVGLGVLGGVVFGGLWREELALPVLIIS